MSTASKVAATKEAHPERYCPTKRCLWHTGNGHLCPRHESHMLLRRLVADLFVSYARLAPALAELHTHQMDVPGLQQQLQHYIRAGIADTSNWYPACMGTEEPFKSRSGLRLLYVWQPATGKHAYINLDTDIILSDEEATAALAI